MVKKYIIWLPEEVAMEMCQKYEMEDYYLGIDPVPQKEKTFDRVWKDCKHGRWLSPCPICTEENDRKAKEPEDDKI